VNSYLSRLNRFPGELARRAFIACARLGRGGLRPGLLGALLMLLPVEALAGQIRLEWNASPTAGVTYRVYYGTASSPEGNHPLIRNVGTQLTDTVPDLTNGVRYYFVVKAVSAAGAVSSASNEVSGFPGSSLSFTDDPLLPGVHNAKVVHMSELRSRIDGLRAARGLGPFSWTPIASGMMIRASHVNELRTVLSAEYVARNLQAPTYTDNPLAVGTSIKAVHITQLRTFVIDLGG
jgi:hypothetical protein